MPLPIAQPSGTAPEDEFAALTRRMDEQRRRESTLGGVKRIIGIHSGKGGVGKTFFTANLAYALAERGLSVGILDADVDCPNIPKFLGMQQRLHVDKEKRFVPANHHGVKVVSMGLTKDDEGEPILIRGPAKHRVAVDLLTNSAWGALDFLIVDLPPGTSDVPMSLLEFGGVSGMLYITSPQKEAIMDTRKSIRMGKSFGLHAIGIVENMSGTVFGQDRALALSEELGVPYLGSIPLDGRIMAANERGDIIFTDVDFEPIVEPIVEAVRSSGVGREHP